MTLQAFWDALSKFDWYYPMSDDGRVYRQGQQRERELTAVAGTSPEHKAMYEAFKASVFSGPPYGTPKLERPARPD